MTRKTVREKPKLICKLGQVRPKHLALLTCHVHFSRRTMASSKVGASFLFESVKKKNTTLTCFWRSYEIQFKPARRCSRNTLVLSTDSCVGGKSRVCANLF